LAPAGRAAAEGASDRAVAQKIAQDLKASGQLQDYRVGVKFQDGVAWLMGTVTSKEQKATAERIARQSAGVDRVISKLTVSAPAIAAPAADESVQLAGGVEAEEYQMPEAELPVARPIAMPVRQARGNMPVPYARMAGPGQGPVQPANYGGGYCPPGGMGPGGMGPGGMGPGGMQAGGGYMPTGMTQAASYDNPQMPGYAWPSYAAYPNYAGVSYPQQYSPTAWPYIGPFYPYPQVPLGWRKVTLEWDDGWWFLDFKDQRD
jgi:BON domain